MNLRWLMPVGIILLPFSQLIYAADCQPNGLGGSFCINDDGTTTDSMPNETNGMDTISNNGTLTTTESNDNGSDAELDGSSLSTTDEPSPDEHDKALMGNDWNSPSNLGDGSATSRMSVLDQP
ncbi:RND transporter [Klebsiella pneumoniae]|uniref:RND transporter n=1 Tax=Klebsiella pneumoniae TaxID=573 RepID=UPI001FACA126|nr:RND transporter [Klebsiella pneumoniae]